ncbi:MAG: acetyl-CoA carboxylase carboxyl transferase subunit beta [Nitrospirae bacterium]|nr:acetyl-CoA carboxylase carboxyl transferase subunit beta [Nitrospirota bacterium]
MAWFKKEKIAIAKKVKVPEGLWVKCDNCKEIVYRKEVEKNLKVCPKCNYHFRISALERIQLLVDEASLNEIGNTLLPRDILNFKDHMPYKERLKESQKKTNINEAAIAGSALMGGYPVVLVVLDFTFMGGSMGTVVGEKVTLATEKADREKPYITILTDPTFGGVTASFAMLGDIIIAEPKSLIGFAGPRVIEQTIKQQLPEDFQRAEFLLQHGLIDLIVNRKDLKQTIARLLSIIAGNDKSKR